MGINYIYYSPSTQFIVSTFGGGPISPFQVPLFLAPIGYHNHHYSHYTSYHIITHSFIMEYKERVLHFEFDFHKHYINLKIKLKFLNQIILVLCNYRLGDLINIIYIISFI